MDSTHLHSIVLIEFYNKTGALNTVGRYIVNMTRGQEASLGQNKENSAENVPDAILTLTKNVLGQNVTKTIEPLIKRVGAVETQEDVEAIETKKKKKQKVKRKDQDSYKKDNISTIATTSTSLVTTTTIATTTSAPSNGKNHK